MSKTSSYPPDETNRLLNDIRLSARLIVAILIGLTLFLSIKL